MVVVIVGVDVSSRRIDLAWISEDCRPCRWHQDLGGPKTHLIDRLRSIRIEWPATVPVTLPGHAGSVKTNYDWRPGHGITDVAVEYPFGRGNAIAALMATVGVITRQAPPWSRVAWPSSGELRQAIGARNTKQDAKRAIFLIGLANAWNDLPRYDEHELDALVAAVGWTRILDQQEHQ